MSITKVAAIQMNCSTDVNTNIEHAVSMVKEAAKNGANIILLPELFERQYFCQERRYDYYKFALPTLENPAVKTFSELSGELNVVIPVSFYEKSGKQFFNSIAMIDNHGDIMGVYRKTHIPDDHYYQEKFYFTPGNTGFKVWKTEFGNVGVGICWDQWFPEAARCMVLDGADILLYPTAIGSEPILDVDSSGHWKRTMQGHSAANITPVVAANRYGLEEVLPCKENGNQSSALTFYGNSFITNETGEIIQCASKDKDEILYAEFDFEKIEEERSSWGLFRDRRPKQYLRISE